MQRWIGPLRIIGVGWYIAACLVIGIVGGLWLDGLLGVSPLFLIVGVIGGTTAAFVGAYRMIFNKG